MVPQTIQRALPPIVHTGFTMESDTERRSTIYTNTSSRAKKHPHGATGFWLVNVTLEEVWSAEET